MINQCFIFLFALFPGAVVWFYEQLMEHYGIILYVHLKEIYCPNKQRICIYTNAIWNFWNTPFGALVHLLPLLFLKQLERHEKKTALSGLCQTVPSFSFSSHRRSGKNAVKPPSIPPGALHSKPRKPLRL